MNTITWLAIAIAALALSTLVDERIAKLFDKIVARVLAILLYPFMRIL